MDNYSVFKHALTWGVVFGIFEGWLVWWSQGTFAQWVFDYYLHWIVPSLDGIPGFMAMALWQTIVWTTLFAIILWSYGFIKARWK